MNPAPKAAQTPLETEIISGKLTSLRAGDYCPSGASQEVKDAALFELPSTRFQKEFVSVFGIFRQPDLFELCLSGLAAKANEIRCKNPFDLVITCTSSAKVILEHIHDRIQGSDDVRIQYLGAHPYISPDRDVAEQVRGARVLIVTDVIATGQLVTQMAEMVYKLGGTPQAVLAVAAIGQKVLASDSVKAADTKGSTHALKIHYLVRREIERFESIPVGDPAPTPVLVHPETVLPDEVRNGHPLSKPFFSHGEFLFMVEQANAIDFGFFQAETRIITTAIRIQQLLTTSAGDLIWEKCWQRVLHPALCVVPHGKTRVVLATTFAREDLEFLGFIKGRLDQLDCVSSRLDVAYAHQTEDPDDIHGHFLPRHDRGLVDGAEVVLLLAAPVGSERVRKLVALLASDGASHIRVLCLLNRMGRQTDTFIQRVRRLLRGREPGEDDETIFQFDAIFTISEADRVGLERMKRRMDEIFQTYARHCQAPSFQQWMEHERKYFIPAYLTSRKFLAATPTPLISHFKPAWEAGTEVRTLEGKLHLISTCIGEASKDFAPLLTLLQEETVDKAGLYRLTGIIIANLSYLKLRSVYQKLRGLLVDQIVRARQHRLALEQALAGGDERERIRGCLNQEIHAAFALALLSYLDQDTSCLYKQQKEDAEGQQDKNEKSDTASATPLCYNDYPALIESMLTWDMTWNEQQSHPVNLELCFSEERMAWVVSALWHLSSYPQVSHGDITQPTWKERLALLHRHFDNRVSQLPSTLPASVEEREERDSALRKLVRIRNNLATLLGEFTTLKNARPHDLLRYLHSKVINVSKHHNPLVSSLKKIEHDLGRVLAEAREQAKESGGIPGAQPVSFERHERGRILETNLQDAVYGTGELTQVAAQVEALFASVTSFDRAGTERYTGPNSAFSRNTQKLAHVILELRRDKAVSTATLELYSRLSNKVTTDLYDADSPLRRALNGFRVRLFDMLPSYMDECKNDLSKVRAKVANTAWDPVLHKWKALAANPHGKGVLVLCDPGLFRECVKNIFANIRYTFENITDHHIKDSIPSPLCVGLAALDASGAEQPVESWLESTARPTPSRWRLCVKSRGNAFDPEAFEAKKDRSTFAGHQREIDAYGGTLEIGPLAEKEFTGCQVTLTLLARQPLRDELEQPSNPPSSAI